MIAEKEVKKILEINDAIKTLNINKFEDYENEFKKRGILITDNKCEQKQIRLINLLLTVFKTYGKYVPNAYGEVCPHCKSDYIVALTYGYIDFDGCKAKHFEGLAIYNGDVYNNKDYKCLCCQSCFKAKKMRLY